jgi:hypothetical protein
MNGGERTGTSTSRGSGINPDPDVGRDLFRLPSGPPPFAPLPVEACPFVACCKTGAFDEVPFMQERCIRTDPAPSKTSKK